MPSRGHSILAGALTFGMLMLLIACSATSSETLSPSTDPPVESIARCYGYTARLTLVQAAGDASPVAVPSAMVGGMQWQLVVEVPAGIAIDEQATASLDTFTIRGDRANRRDLALARWSGSAQSLMVQGPVLLPEMEGGIREGDRGRILAWIQTPGGSFGVEGLTFQLRPDGPNVAIVDPSPLPEESCPAS